MNDATLQGFRSLHAATSTSERTMTAAAMALTSWGKVWQDVNVNPATGERWAFDARRNLFVAY